MSASETLKIGWLTQQNPAVMSSFSGVFYFGSRALMRRQDVELQVLGQFRPSKLRRRLPNPPRPYVDLSHAKSDGLDALVGMMFTGRLLELPVAPGTRRIHVTDATPAIARDYYERTGAAYEKVLADETRTIAHSHRVLYSAPSIAAAARAEFPPELHHKIGHARFGVNLSEPPKAATPRALGTPMRLLFIGSQWARKGGPTALAVLDLLRARGIPARLDIIGERPDAVAGRDDCAAHGFLKKQSPREGALYERLVSQADVLLLPTTGDATPMAVGELAAYSVPTIAADVGGVADVLSDGVSGRLMPAGSPPEAYADVLQGWLDDPQAYADLRQSAFAYQRDNLSWDSWAAEVVAQIREG